MNSGNPDSESAHLASTYTTGSQRVVTRPATSASSVNSAEMHIFDTSLEQTQKLWHWDQAISPNKPPGDSDTNQNWRTTAPHSLLHDS